MTGRVLHSRCGPIGSTAVSPSNKHLVSSEGNKFSKKWNEFQKKAFDEGFGKSCLKFLIFNFNMFKKSFLF